MQNGVSSSFITASDGLRLHARCYGSRTASAAPVICLPGLTRTAADFEALASALSHEKPFRRVIALDYRGRGLSQYDRNPANYALPGRACRCARGRHRARCIARHLRRNVARRHSHDAAGRRTADRDRRRRAQRYRPGDRAAGPDAHQELCRQAAAAAQFRGRRRDPAPTVQRPIPQT